MEMALEYELVYGLISCFDGLVWPLFLCHIVYEIHFWETWL